MYVIYVLDDDEIVSISNHLRRKLLKALGPVGGHVVSSGFPFLVLLLLLVDDHKGPSRLLRDDDDDSKNELHL